MTLIFSFLVFLSCNEMFTRCPSQRLLNKLAAAVRQSDTVGVFKSRAETHLFSTALTVCAGTHFTRQFLLLCLLSLLSTHFTLVFSAALISGHTHRLKHTNTQSLTSVQTFIVLRQEIPIYTQHGIH